jgi:hypothetical protein
MSRKKHPEMAKTGHFQALKRLQANRYEREQLLIQ